VQDGRLYLLQTRTAQRTPWAVLRTAVDTLQEGLIAPDEALSRLAEIATPRNCRKATSAGTATVATAARIARKS
jgi:pyruvate, orthophosphate dikinase